MVPDSQNGVWLLTGVYNLLNALLFALCALVFAIRRLPASAPSARRSLLCSNLWLALLLSLRGVLGLALFRSQEQTFYSGR